MSNISDEVLKVLLDNGISYIDISNELYKIQNEIESKLWEKITISSIVFYTLKDTIFYNFEYLNYSDMLTGKTNLNSYGKNYPIFMLQFNNQTYIENKFIKELINELDDVKSKWNKNIYAANLYSKNEFDWKIGNENPSRLIIYDKSSESPTKYGYYNNNSGNYSNIYGIDGNLIKKEDETVLCSINKIDMYREYNLLTRSLDNVYYTIKQAEKNGKGILIDFENTDYQT